MLCDNCKKNEATIHFSQMINNKIQESHFCSECMSKVDYFSFDDIFNGFFAGFNNTKQIKEEANVIRCKNCNMTSDEFTKIGRFGCADCYKSFNEQIKPVFKKIGSTRLHMGKFPYKSDITAKIKKRIIENRKKLEEAIVAEEFEEAAKFRDEIKELEKSSKEDA